jgi:hypothetical protein
MSNDDVTPSPLEGGSAAAAGKSREDDLVRANELMMSMALALESKELDAENVRAKVIEECAKVAEREAAIAQSRGALSISQEYTAPLRVASAIRSLRKADGEPAKVADVAETSRSENTVAMFVDPHLYAHPPSPAVPEKDSG